MSDETITEDVATGTATAEPVVTPEKSKAKPRKQPPYAVIVENDELHTFPYVIEVLQRICGHTLEQAFTLTSQVHYQGRAVVWSGSLEVAELKRDQIRGFGPDRYAPKPVEFPLGVRIEQMPE